jgi:hypothetical protein
MCAAKQVSPRSHDPLGIRRLAEVEGEKPAKKKFKK